MATQAAIGLGTLVSVESTTPGSYIDLAEITSVTPPEDTVDQIDVTHMQSPGRRREFISGLIDGGEGSFDLNWVPGSATDDLIFDWQAEGDTRNLRITYPAIGGADRVTHTFPAFVTGYSRAVPVDDRMTATLTVKMAGALTVGTEADD